MEHVPKATVAVRVTSVLSSGAVTVTAPVSASMASRSLSQVQEIFTPSSVPTGRVKSWFTIAGTEIPAMASSTISSSVKL